MISSFKLLLLLLIAATGCWVYFVPPLYKFVIKYSAYKRVFPPEDFVTIAGDNVTVELSLGKIIGTTIKPNLVDYFTGTDGQPAKGQVRNVHQFLGIPFATPPVGKLRFKKPKPVQKWSPKVIEAVKWPASCMQNDRLMELLAFATKEFSEDCLYMNIWTPALPSAKSDKLKPVFVWIYGGGFSMGSGSQTVYHGHILSSTQDVVVVTFNYRLGPFGFLVSPDATTKTDSFAPGNVGLWDQVAALEWIQDHIRYFGGDPNQVTIAGESAGGISVSALFNSPVTRNLFNNIIPMSGSSLLTTGFKNRETEVPKTRRLAEIVNCPSDNDQKMMDCLIKTDPNKLVIRDIELVRTFPGQETIASGIMIFNPVSGDELLPSRPKEIIKNGFEGQLAAERKKVRVLTGVVNWEGGLMRLVKKDPNSMMAKLERTNTWTSGITKWLIDDHGMTESDAKKVIEAYGQMDQVGSAIKLKREGEMMLFDIVGDFYLLCPAYFETESITKSVKSIHQYLFSFKPVNNELLNIICPDKDLVCHGLELGYFFGGPLSKAGKYFYDQSDYDQAIQTTNAVGQFVRNEKLTVPRTKTVKSGQGEKKTTELIDWVKYDPKLKTSVTFNHMKNNPFVLDFRGKHCELFRKYIL